MTKLQQTYEAKFGSSLRDILTGALRETRVARRAAERLGLGYRTFYLWCRQEGIDPAAVILDAKLSEAA